jgi:hypothetical protein
MAATTRNQTSIDGALYELVARGVKDTYFIKDEKDSVQPFNWTYERWPASLPETRWTNPLNQPRWGQRCEFEFDLPGDVLMEASLVVELPSWLPPEMITSNQTSDTYLTENPEKVYGYVNGIGYFLFEKIEIYQDKILLQEVSGDSLYVASLSRGNWNQGFLKQQLAGVHDGSRLSIMRNATPGRLEIQLPMIGCSWEGDRGLPLCGLRNQTFRLRLTLRPLESLIETNTNEQTPSPWEKEFTQDRDVDDVSGLSLARPLMKQPTIYLKTKQLYLLNEAREQLAKETIEVPYIRYFDNHFSANQLDYAPFDLNGNANIIKFLDANYNVERIMTYFRNTASVAQNRLWDFENSKLYTNGVENKGQFYNSVQLVIAGQVREGPWAPDVWQNVVIDAKQERSLGRNIITMDWSRGWRIEDQTPAIREPTGGINFTTADRPMLTISLNDIDVNPVLGYKQAQMISCCESWALYRIRNGRGGLEYAN